MHNVKTVPMPPALSTVRSPPSARARRRLFARPIPTLMFPPMRQPADARDSRRCGTAEHHLQLTTLTPAFFRRLRAAQRSGNLTLEHPQVPERPGAIDSIHAATVL